MRWFVAISFTVIGPLMILKCGIGLNLGTVVSLLFGYYVGDLVVRTQKKQDNRSEEDTDATGATADEVSEDEAIEQIKRKKKTVIAALVLGSIVIANAIHIQLRYHLTIPWLWVPGGILLVYGIYSMVIASSGEKKGPGRRRPRASGAAKRVDARPEQQPDKIRMQCTKCGATGNGERERIKKKRRCPKCKQVVRFQEIG